MIQGLPAAEESARFPGLSLFASRVLSGQSIPDELLLRCDAQGITLATALCRFAGSAPDELDQQEALRRARHLIHESVYPLMYIGAFLELHVEQSTILDDAGDAVGVVDCAAGTTRLHLIIQGNQGQAGTVMMEQRHDALTAAAEAILLVETICRAHSPPAVVTSVSMRSALS
jgi:hypothetical protein